MQPQIPVAPSTGEQTLEQALTAIVLELPIERACEVLDFALFLQTQMVAVADDAAWDQAFAMPPQP